MSVIGITTLSVYQQQHLLTCNAITGVLLLADTATALCTHIGTVLAVGGALHLAHGRALAERDTLVPA